VPASSPRRSPDPAAGEHHRTPQIYTLETTGLLIIAVVLLILTVIRYWHHLSWSLR